jgi:hypothetical protein
MLLFSSGLIPKNTVKTAFQCLNTQEAMLCHSVTILDHGDQLKPGLSAGPMRLPSKGIELKLHNVLIRLYFLSFIPSGQSFRELFAMIS